MTRCFLELWRDAPDPHLAVDRATVPLGELCAPTRRAVAALHGRAGGHVLTGATARALAAAVATVHLGPACPYDEEGEPTGDAVTVVDHRQLAALAAALAPRAGWLWRLRCACDSPPPPAAKDRAS